MTMTIQIRTADPEQDYDSAVHLINTFEHQPITADDMRKWDSMNTPKTVRRRRVAVFPNGSTAGYSSTIHEGWMTEGYFIIWVIAAPDCRGQGIGTALYKDALSFAREQGANVIGSDVLENDPQSLKFAEKRGFEVTRHIFESTIDLNQFDETRFAGVIEAVEAQGIHLFSLAEAGDTPENRYKLWQVNYETSLQDPGSLGEFPSFEEFTKIFDTANWFRPEGQILAADGERFIGLSAVGHFAENHSAYNMMTGVLQDYRGRGIAQAMKLHSIRAAKKWGADFIRTNNDSTNTPMLSINRKLGYTPEPGMYRLVNNINR